MGGVGTRPRVVRLVIMTVLAAALIATAALAATYRPAAPLQSYPGTCKRGWDLVSVGEAEERGVRNAERRDRNGNGLICVKGRAGRDDR
jgi:hypothetical protein